MAKTTAVTKVTDKHYTALIEDGYDLDQKIKKLTADFNAIKEEVKGLGDGTFMTKKGRSVVISSTPKYTDVNPTEAFKWLKKNGFKSQFDSVFKVAITGLKKLTGDAVLNGMRQEVTSTVRASFK